MNPSPLAALRPRPLYAVLAAAAIAMLAWAFWPRAEPVETARVIRGPLTVGFREEARTRLRERYVVATPVDGVVDRLTLEPGDAVAVGAPVATLRPLRAALLDPANRAQTQARFRAADSELASARAALASAEAERRRTTAERERGASLARERLIAQSDYDALRSQATAADAAVRAAQARVQTLAVLRDGTRAVLALQGAAADDVRPLVVRAPVAGRVMRRHVESESPVRVGQPLLELGDPRALEVVAEVLTEDAVRLRPGATVRLTRWGGEHPLHGLVRSVEPGGFTKASALGVEEQRTLVVVALRDATTVPPMLGDGFRIEAEFVTWAGDDVLQVPTAALFRDGEHWAVYAVSNGRAQLRRVRIGHLGDVAAQVLSGVASGTTVIVYPGSAIRDGSRVAPPRE